MTPIRILARLDVKSQNVIKGIHLEGLRVIGKPFDLATKYYADGADEIVYMDTVASLYGRSNILPVVQQAAEDIFVPLTVGGGIRTEEDIVAALRSGADKVAINTAAIKDPAFLTRGANALGSQCITLSIETKNRAPGKWEALTDNGREMTGVDVLEWAKEGERLGAGEILLTSVDQEGTQTGFDIDLIGQVRDAVRIPVIAAGGAGKAEHVIKMIKETGCDAICCAAIFHYKKLDIPDLKRAIADAGFEVRL